MNQCNGVELPTGEPSIDRAVIDMSAPFHLEWFRLLAATPRYLEPFVGECTAHTAERTLSHHIADRGFHHAPSR